MLNLECWTLNMESNNKDKEEILNYCDKLNPAETTVHSGCKNLQDLVHHMINALCTVI